MMFQVRDEEDPESRAGRLARDRDHHAQVIKKMSKMMTLLMTMFIISKLKIVYVGKVCRLQARNQEDPVTNVQPPSSTTYTTKSSATIFNCQYQPTT